MNRYKQMALAALFCVPMLSKAAVTSYDSKSAYDSAVSGNIVDLNFDSMTAGDTISSGSAISDVTFLYSFDTGIDITIENQFATTSPSNYLGSSDGGLFIGGDSITFDFSQTVTAFGIYVLSDAFVLDDDFAITTNNGDSASSTVSSALALSDGFTDAYFIGLVESDASQAFTSVTFTSFEEPTLTFNIDDISYATVSAVPEPSILLMMLGGTLSIFALTGMKRKRKLNLVS